MSLKPNESRPVPEETRKVAKAAFPKGNVYLWIGDELGELYADQLFNDPYPLRGQPTVSPGRLALITILQFMEGMTDRQAAEAVRARIDWKYALGLELTDPGFVFSVLSEFRQRLIAGQKEQVFLDVLLDEPSVWATPYRGRAIPCGLVTYSSKTIAQQVEDSRNRNHYRAFAALKDLLGERPLVLDREFSYLELMLNLVEEQINWVIRLNLRAHPPKFFDRDKKEVVLTISPGETIIHNQVWYMGKVWVNLIGTWKKGLSGTVQN